MAAPATTLAPPLTGVPPNDPRVQRLNPILTRHEINPNLVSKILTLSKYEIVVVCDDSGSMRAPAQGPKPTRWEELKYIAGIVIDIAAALDTNGVDLYFLHREPLLNLKDTSTIGAKFAAPPAGATPLVPVLKKIVAEKTAQAYEKKLLILIATDGAPTNADDDVDIAPLEEILKSGRTEYMHVEFLACTDDHGTMSYLNGWDKTYPRVDVVDDYRSEEAEVKRLRGNTFQFSFGDYIVKALLGSTEEPLDIMDERL